MAEHSSNFECSTSSFSTGQWVRMNRDTLDLARLLGPILLIHLERLDLGQGGQAVVANDLAEDGVEPVEVRRLVEDDEELRAVRSRALIGHGDHPPLRVLQRRADLVVEGAAPDGAAALWVFGGRGVCGRARLGHEARDEAVEGRGVVVMGSAEGEEVLRRGSLC